MRSGLGQIRRSAPRSQPISTGKSIAGPQKKVAIEMTRCRATPGSRWLGESASLEGSRLRAEPCRETREWNLTRHLRIVAFGNTTHFEQSQFLILLSLILKNE